jgi:uncharacterized protein YbbK (DUF523 family)
MDIDEKEPVLVSACLIGIDCRYDGRNSFKKNIVEFLTGKIPVPYCPEVFGGLGIPREGCEIVAGDGNDVLNNLARVLSYSGLDFTKNFLNGSMWGLKICMMTGIRRAILKENSPSCGVKQIIRNRKTTSGMGVFAALLRKNNIEIISSDEI